MLLLLLLSSLLWRGNGFLSLHCAFTCTSTYYSSSFIIQSSNTLVKKRMDVCNTFQRQPCRYRTFFSSTKNSVIYEEEEEILTATKNIMSNNNLVVQDDDDNEGPEISKSWWKRYHELKSYHEKHGHCNVSRKENGIGNWVQKQRAAYKLYQQLRPKATATDERSTTSDRLNGDVVIKNDGEEAKKTNTKVYNSYGNRPTPLNEKQIDLLNDLDFIWNVHEWKYQLNLKDLEVFYEQYGHINIPSSASLTSTEEGEYNRSLYKWLCRQKEEYRKYLNGIDCNLTNERRQSLEKLGFHIGMFDLDADSSSSTSTSNKTTRISWEGRFQELSEFICENGHCNIPRNNDKYSQLSGWVQHQRAEKKKKKRGSKSRLTDEKERRLDDIGFVWSIQDKVWNERLNELREFKSEHSHVRVPTKCGKLGNWVMIQRLQYSKKRKGEKHTLTDERIEALDEVGFEWDIHEISWEDKFITLKECMQNYNAKKDEEESVSSYITSHAPTLIPWVSAQRAEKRYKNSGLHSHLTDERETKLNEINFDWNADEDRRQQREASWRENFEKLKAYKNDNGTLRVPVKKDQTDDEKSFSHWVRDQRRYFIASEKGLKTPMTEARRDLLLSIGFADDITL